MSDARTVPGLYAFEEADAELRFMPLSSRRALDHTGLKLSLVAWLTLPWDRRCRLCELGAKPRVDTDAVAALLGDVEPAPQAVAPAPEPDASRVPEAVAGVSSFPLSQSAWSALSALDRYALYKVSLKGDPERFGRALSEVVGHSTVSSHIAPGGGVRMVDVGHKAVTRRQAVATATVRMSRDAFERLQKSDVPKGNVIDTARVAGIQASKKTSELIPLCHPLPITKVNIDISLDSDRCSVSVLAEVETVDRTGVEMEALTAASVAALTIYDMMKSLDRGMVLENVCLLEKSGGVSGDFRA